MSRRWQVALFGAGAALFAYLVGQIGLGQLAADAARTGWMFVPIVGLYALVYACSALAWRLTMASDPPSRRPSFWRLWIVLVSSGALNVLTPVINAGGEPYRVAALGPWLGKRRAAGSVILHRMVHSLSYVLVWLTAVGLAVLFLPPSTPAFVYLLLALVGVVLLGIIALFLFAHRRGVLERILNVMHRVPLVTRLARLLEPRRAVVVELDRQIVDFYHGQPRRFWQAIGLEYLSRCIFMLELMLIATSVGLALGYWRAFTIGGLEAMLGNVLFFVPFELGAREGAYYGLFNLFGIDPQFGLYTSIVSRVRDFVWIGAGLLLIWAAGSSKPSTFPAASAVPPA